MKWDLKLVPNDDPNADGRWVTRELEGEPTFDTVVEDGFHIVKMSPNVDQPFNMSGNLGWWM